jgi:hypothetical protein
MTKTTLFTIAACATAILLPRPAAAQTQGVDPAAAAEPIAASVAAEAARAAADPQDPQARPVAIEFSEGYERRGKIHKYASYATAPLFATELWLGQSLYNDPQGLTSAKRGAHIAVGTAITALFAVNTVTGVWNMVEGWKAPAGRNKRLIHGLLMMGADVGFLATASSGPGGRNSLINFDANKSRHRTIAFTSIGLGSAGYLMMLFGGH